MASTAPASLSTMLGVAVASAPTAAEKAAIAASESKPEGGDDDDDKSMLIVALAAGAAAVGLLFALGITCAVCACKGRSSQPAVKPAAITGQDGKKAAATLKGNTPL